jgi:hypothetical protein
MLRMLDSPGEQPTVISSVVEMRLFIPDSQGNSLSIHRLDSSSVTLSWSLNFVYENLSGKVTSVQNMFLHFLSNPLCCLALT